MTLMAVLGVASITPAFPKMVREMGLANEQVGMLITAFTLPGVILVPFLGVMADRLGRKRVLVPSLFLFGVAGTACTFYRDFDTILLLRVFQGIGSAGLGSINLTILGDLYSGRRRAEAMGLNASVLSIGTATYPVIGGALAVLGWYYPFALSFAAIPIGLLVLVGLRSPEPGNSRNLRQYLGDTWNYLQNARVVGLFAVGTLTFILLFGPYLTFFPLLLADSFHTSPVVIGLIISSMSLTTAAVSSQLGRISTRFSETTIIKGSFALYAVGLAMIPLAPGAWFSLLPSVIFGIAHGANIPNIQTAILGIVPLEYRAAFMSINATMFLLGQTLGPVLAGLVYTYWGLNSIFFAAAGLALVAPGAVVLAGRLNRPEKSV